MRRRLRKFLPIVLMALAVQILAPIAACWAASIAASDPLSAAVICHDSAASTSDQTGNQTDQSGGQHAHDDGCCLACGIHAGASVDPPQISIAAPYRQPKRVIWREVGPDLSGSGTGSHAQARAPPSIS
jgi:hypothetical protein